MPKLDSYPLAKPCPGQYHTDSSWKELFCFQQNNINLSLCLLCTPNHLTTFQLPPQKLMKRTIRIFLGTIYYHYCIFLPSVSFLQVFQNPKMLCQKQKLYMCIFFFFLLKFSILPDLGKHPLGHSFRTISKIFRKIYIIKIKIQPNITVLNIDPILRSIQRRPQMQFSMGPKFMLWRYADMT